MLETIHEYARERLRERTDAEATHLRHAEYFLTLAEESEPLLGGPEQVAWFERLETENDNLRAAISWAIGHGEAELGLRLAQALRPFWYARGHYVEGRGWVARFLTDLGELFVVAEAYARAQHLYEEVLVLSRQMDDAPTLVECLIELSHISLFQNDHQKAAGLGEEAVALSRDLGYEVSLSRALNCLGWAALLQGNHKRAEDWFERSLALYREPADNTIAAEGLEGLACVAGASGEARLSARLFGAAEAAGYGRTPGQRALREPYLAAARSLTDETTWQAAYTEGRSTVVERIIPRALGNTTNSEE
jgi:tetratricopeptide (TPR) repeat protein